MKCSFLLIYYCRWTVGNGRRNESPGTNNKRNRKAFRHEFLALFNQRTFNAMVPINQTSAIPRTSTGLRLRQHDSMPEERLPKLSLAGAAGGRGIYNGHGQHKQSSPTTATTPRPSGSHPSRPIPLPRTHITRTASELQLREDMAVAEWREMCMFRRLVDGMKERQQAQHQHVTSCHQQRAAYGDSQDSTPHPSSGKQQQLPTTITPQESPVFIEDSNRSARLVEMLHRASLLGDLTGTETTTTSTTFNSSSISATAINDKQRTQQAQLQGNGWPLEAFAHSLSTTIPSYVHNDDDNEGEDEGIFTLDL